MDVERRVRVWLQLSYMMMTEGDALAYKYPRDPADEPEIAVCTAASKRFYDKACEVAGGKTTQAQWTDAVDSLGRVSPGTHVPESCRQKVW